MNLNNLLSLNSSIEHIETHYNPNLKTEYKSTSLMSRQAIEEFQSIKNDFFIKNQLNILYEKANLLSKNIEDYNLTYDETTIKTAENTPNIIYIPKYFYSNNQIKINKASELIIDKLVEKIIISDDILDLNIINNYTSVIDAYYPHLDLSMTLNEKILYKLGHQYTFKDHGISSDTIISKCACIALGKNYFNGIINENRTYGNFTNVDKVFVYDGCFDDSLTTEDEKATLISKVLTIDKTKVNFYACEEYIYEINNSDKLKYNDRHGLTYVYPTESSPVYIKVDELYPRYKHILDLTNLAGKNVGLERTNTTSSNVDLTGVIIPNGLSSYIYLSIAMNRGFNKCINLKFAKLSVCIGNMFVNCRNLKYVYLDNNVTDINENCFKDCKSLNYIVAPSTLKTIKSDAFTGCSNMLKIIINTANTITFSGTSSGLTSKIYVNSTNINNAKSYFVNCKIVEFTDEIVYYSGKNPTIDFSKTYTKNIILLPDPNNIPYGTLRKINSGGNVESKLVDVFIDGVDTIDTNLFNNCSSINTVNMSDTIMDIRSSAFENCSGITTVTIPDSIQAIKNNIFKNCTSLTEVKIPSTIKLIEDNAFEGCPNVQIIRT